MVCKLSFAHNFLCFLGCLDWNICFTQIFFSILISVWSFQCTQSLLKQSHLKLLRNFHTNLCRNISWLWLNLYQSSEVSTLWILWSLVKPVLSKTALPCWSRLALACPFYIRSSACIAVIFLLIWQPPAFPYRHQYSIIGRFRLNHRVRDVDGCFPKAHRHQKYEAIYSGLSLVLVTRSITLPLHLARVIRPIRLRFHSILLINQRLSCLLIRQSSLITKQWITFTRFP